MVLLILFERLDIIIKEAEWNIDLLQTEVWAIDTHKVYIMFVYFLLFFISRILS